MFISKGSYGNGHCKNVLPQTMQILHLPVRGTRLTCFMGGSIGPRIEICENSGLPISMVLRLHQRMVISKGSYGHGEFQNVQPQSVDIPYLPVRSRELPRFMGGSIGPRMEIYAKLRAYQSPWYRVCTKSMVILKRSYGNGEFKKCIAIVGAHTALTSTGPHTTPIDWGQNNSQNGTLRKFGPTNFHATGFAPKKRLYRNEAAGMESSKMNCPSQCKYRTYQCGAANYPVLSAAVQGPEWNFAKFWAYQSRWFRV